MTPTTLKPMEEMKKMIINYIGWSLVCASVGFLAGMVREVVKTIREYKEIKAKCAIWDIK